MSAAEWGMTRKSSATIQCCQQNPACLDDSSMQCKCLNYSQWSKNLVKRLQLSASLLFWESELKTQDWTLAITLGGQEPEQAHIWCLAFITYSVFLGGHMQASTCCDICLWKTEVILLSPTLIQHLWTQRGKTEVHPSSFQGAGAIDPCARKHVISRDSTARYVLGSRCQFPFFNSSASVMNW